MEEFAGCQVEHVVFLQPTSPFRNAQHIDSALQKHLYSHKNSLIAVTDVQEFHPYFMFKLDSTDSLAPLFQFEKRPLRRQYLPAFYRINGAIYISKRSYYTNLPDKAAIFDWNSLAAYVMDAPSSIDINDYLDFQRAELMLREKGDELG